MEEFEPHYNRISCEQPSNCEFHPYSFHIKYLNTHHNIPTNSNSNSNLFDPTLLLYNSMITTVLFHKKFYTNITEKLKTQKILQLVNLKRSHKPYKSHTKNIISIWDIIQNRPPSVSMIISLQGRPQIHPKRQRKSPSTNSYSNLSTSDSTQHPLKKK